MEIINDGCTSLTVTYEDAFLDAEGDECYFVERTYHIVNDYLYDGVSAPVVISRDEDCDGLEGEEAVWLHVRPDFVVTDSDEDWFNAVPEAGTKGTACDGTTNEEGYWRLVNTVGYWTYTQRIKVFDTDAPVVDFEIPEPFCAENLEDCTGTIDYPFTISDGCVVDSITNITIVLDADADGMIDGNVTDEVLTGTFPDYSLVGEFPIGTHNFIVLIVDGCGNQTSLLMPFVVMDCNLAQVQTVETYTVELDPQPLGVDADGDGDDDLGAYELFASELVTGSLVDCSEPISFSINRVGETPDISQESLVLTCDDMDLVDVEVYAWDRANNPYSIQPDGTIGGPNYTWSEVAVSVQDPLGACEGLVQFTDMISGKIYTEYDDGVEGVEVNLIATGLSELTLTDVNGDYGFEDLTVGETYTVRPFLDIDHKNGVSTLDIIILQQHLLGINDLDSPYQRIAADVNNSGTITTLDAIEMQKLVLGDIDRFQSNTSWRFVAADYDFPEPFNPWFELWPESITDELPIGGMDEVDFIAVKIGDLNNTVETSMLMDLEERNFDRSMNLDIDDQLLRGGKTYYIPVRTSDLSEIKGYQFTLGFDQESVELIDLEYGLMNAANFGRAFVREGLITASWHDINNDYESGQSAELFTLVIRAQNDVQLSKVLELNSRKTRTEAYDRYYDHWDVALNFEIPAVQADNFELYQNQPNPFHERTLISFELPQAAKVELTIHNVSGQILRKVNGEFEAGLNQIEINGQKLPYGVMYYTIATDRWTATKKMIRTQ